ncbi:MULTISPECIES: hypothetical protein [Rhizobium]|uniref:DUF3618 domain-containing protein n=1 Tax=Rhizobium rhododendri TaxID=2506430 RepID=A0ABY8IEP1_9HYPH|nr:MULTISPECIES: hypothetical protein [Rhizobium]MBZ5763021.1 hypothetical protein [Rhizobium sp. VS19-DR96]MBZ5768893.1 hypothetical protein [Rhizobium sp. VS19-DR129.2]MBZ5776521.1 hypothetical protein [Rhizobium sp. VS19-DRK62.2]MBZ5787677.1 hypothetical protein [Rhizobium sp. VS19-DR121]MBZ5803453.1 hypothetical protein [Rhizobium sp. VS19-DR181]
MATTTDDIKNGMSKDISALQQEITRLQKLVAAQGSEAYSDLRDKAGKLYDDAAPKAKNAVAQIKAESAAAAEAAKEHAAATTTALVVVGLLGLAAGYLLAGASQPEPQRTWWR